MKKRIEQIHQKFRALMFLALAAVMLLAMTVPVSAASASIKLSASKKTLTVGVSVKLKATVTGSSKTVTWKSSKTSVATVSKTGIVKAKKAGTATITAKANGKTAKCVVTVKEAAWAEAYRKLLSASKLKWSDRKNITTSGCKFGLVYVNDDSIPELFVLGSGLSHADGYCKLYTFANGKVKEVGTFHDAMNYYEKKGILESVSFTNAGTFYYYDQMMASGKLTMKLFHAISMSITSYYGDYYYDGSNNEISASIFQSRLKKLVGSVKKKTPAVVPNTAANRAKYLK